MAMPAARPDQCSTPGCRRRVPFHVDRCDQCAPETND